jgi:hypothetical protein
MIPGHSPNFQGAGHCRDNSSLSSVLLSGLLNDAPFIFRSSFVAGSELTKAQMPTVLDNR